jgi:hypothetical protein
VQLLAADTVRALHAGALPCSCRRLCHHALVECVSRQWVAIQWLRKGKALMATEDQEAMSRKQQSSIQSELLGTIAI